MKVIGLTGGIGAGKSTASACLREKGCEVLDADQISHEITEKGSETLDSIAEAFGADMILPDGSLDRKKLASVVFSNKEKLKLLESITTAEVVRIIGQRLNALRNTGEKDLVFVDAPLLFEAGVDKLTDSVWMVTADREIRIGRVMERDGISREAVLARMASQMSDEEKSARSTEIIDNSKGKEALYKQVEALLEMYAETE